MTSAPELLDAAVHNNVEWCATMCLAHGLRSERRPAVWSCPTRTPPFYPDAVTLRPSAPVEEVLDGIDTGPGCSVKDSFADLDLTGAGFRVLFAAEWVALRSPPAARDAPRRADHRRRRLEPQRHRGGPLQRVLSDRGPGRRMDGGDRHGRRPPSRAADRRLRTRPGTRRRHPARVQDHRPASHLAAPRLKREAARAWGRGVGIGSSVNPRRDQPGRARRPRRTGCPVRAPRCAGRCCDPSRRSRGARRTVALPYLSRRSTA
jgi:hypothetical protein